MLAGGVRAEPHVWEGASHGRFGGNAPEDREQIARLKTFFDRVREPISGAGTDPGLADRIGRYWTSS
ncbi:hypothetical protein [Glycomyces tenuis]|nr:hypothetical protein [Glycomyces tenuis]